MPETTENYQLVTAVSVDDFVQPDHNNRLADTVDRVLGSLMRRLLTAGVFDGWNVLSDKTVAAGQGLIGACWCRTLTAQAIVGLMNGALNHVFAESTADSGPNGTISVFAQLSSTAPADSIYLGTLELDAAGNVLAIDNYADGVDRQCYPLSWHSLAGSGTIEDVGASQSASVYVSHDALRIPGAIGFSSASVDFIWEIEETWRSDKFLLTVINNGASPSDFSYEWTREGIAE